MSTVLLVEDDNSLLRIFSFFLEKQGFLVSSFVEPKKALQHLKAEENEYDIILSDIMMPQMSGFEFCGAVKSLEKYASIPFMFISALMDMESKIKGFNLGVDDYIEKPAELESLSLKIVNLIARHRKEIELSEQVSDAQESAMSIMSFYSDLGGVLEFYKESIGTLNVKDLTSVLFNTLDKYGVNASISYFLADESQNFSQSGEMSPLEFNVIVAARTKSRFYTHGNKLFISYPDFTLFIKNMPADEDRAGVLRDSLGVLTNGVEAQLKNIIAYKKILNNNSKSLDSEKILDKAKDLQHELESAMIQAITSLQNELEDAFLSLGLSEVQEEHILDIISSCHDRIKDGLTIGEDLVQQVNKISDNLRDMRSS